MGFSDRKLIIAMVFELLTPECDGPPLASWDGDFEPILGKHLVLSLHEQQIVSKGVFTCA